MNERETDYKRFEGERIISVSDLFEEILRKIWLVIILAAAFAAIFAGYKYASDKSKAENEASTEAYEKSEASLTDEEMREVDNILAMYDEVEAAEQYMENSIRMNIDPYHEDRVVMRFALEAEGGNLTEILQVLNNYVTGIPIVTDLQEFYPDVDSTYLTELLTFAYYEPTLDVSGLENVVYQSNIFTVRVMHTDADSCQQLADAVYQCLDNYVENISSYFGPCSIMLLEEYSSQVYDSSLKSTQNTAVSDQISLMNKITTQTGYLSDDQIEVLEAELAGTIDSEGEVSDGTVNQTSIKVHISRRYTLLGLLIGIVIAVILIVIYYFCRKTLNIVQEFQIGFGIPVFGRLHIKKQRNPLVRAWRRLIYKKKLPIETEQRIAFTNLRNYCNSHHIDSILLAGSQHELPQNSWLNELQTELENGNIKVGIVGGVPDSPEALEELSTYNQIVLVETLHRSLFADVTGEVEICREQNIQIAGAIVFD